MSYSILAQHEHVSKVLGCLPMMRQMRIKQRVDVQPAATVTRVISRKCISNGRKCSSHRKSSLLYPQAYAQIVHKYREILQIIMTGKSSVSSATATPQAAHPERISCIHTNTFSLPSVETLAGAADLERTNLFGGLLVVRGHSTNVNSAFCWYFREVRFHHSVARSF